MMVDAAPASRVDRGEQPCAATDGRAFEHGRPGYSERSRVMTERTFPAPSTVSEQARTWLAVDGGELSYPAAGDTEAWLAMAEQANRSTVRRVPIPRPPAPLADP